MTTTNELDVLDESTDMSSFSYRIFSEKIQQQITQRELDKNETLFLEGASAETVYFVGKGCVRLVVYPQDDKQLVLFRARDNESFGEDHLNIERFEYSAIADKPTVLHMIPKAILSAEIYANAAIAEQYVNCLCSRFSAMRTNFERLGIKSAKQRVIHYLRSNSGSANSINLSGRVKSLSDDLNLTHEAMYRALRELEQDKTIRRKDGVIEIL